MSKHTPGPWGLDNIRRDSASGITTMDIRGPGRPRGPSQRPYRDVVAEIRTDWGTHDEVDANGRLIAAAPDLLDALEALLAAVKANPAMNGREYDGLGIQVNAALSKARGTSSFEPGN